MDLLKLRYIATLLLLFQPFLGFMTFTRAAIISVDYGSEFFKVALVKPGMTMDVILNPKESKRKTDNLLSIDPRNGDVFVGAEAVALSTRFPHLSYPSLQSLLGRNYDDPAVNMYREHIFPSNLKIKQHPTRNSVVFELDPELSQYRSYAANQMDYISVEELVAMILREAKSYADYAAKEDVRDIVLGVPRHFDIQQRTAMMNAAQLAGLRVLELTNEDTAIATQFALSREFTESPQNHIFFDMGAGSLKLTMARFSFVNQTSRSHPAGFTLVEMIGFEHDIHLNGRYFDKKLQTYLLEAFEKSMGREIDVRKHPKPMTKLLREAKRVKEALTVNSHTMASIENFSDNLDLKVKITKEEFENLIQSDMSRVNEILNRLLVQTQVPIDSVSSVVLIGGATRIPLLQKTLRDIVGKWVYISRETHLSLSFNTDISIARELISQTLNADEAIVLGAVFRGASLSKQFRVKPVIVKDFAPFSIDVTYEKDFKQNDKMIQETFEIVNTKTAMPFRQQVWFNKSADFEFTVHYPIESEMNRYHGPLGIYLVSTTNLTETLKSHQTEDLEPTVRFILELNSSGLLSIISADSIHQIHDHHAGSLKDKLWSLWKKQRENVDDAAAQDDQARLISKENAHEEKTAENIDIVDNSNSLDDGQTARVSTDKSSRRVYIPVGFSVKSMGMGPMDQNELQKVIDRINRIENEVRQRKELSDARNSLESYIYQMNDLLDNPRISLVITEIEKNSLRLLLVTMSDWLHDETNHHANREDYAQRLTKLKELEEPILNRLDEHEKRPKLIENLKHTMQSVGDFVKLMLQDIDSKPLLLSRDELDHLLEVLDETASWLEKKERLQSQLPDNQDPILTTTELQSKILLLESEKRILERKLRSSRSSRSSSSVNTATTPTTYNESHAESSSLAKDSENDQKAIDQFSEIDTNQSISKSSGEIIPNSDGVQKLQNDEHLSDEFAKKTSQNDKTSKHHVHSEPDEIHVDL